MASVAGMAFTVSFRPPRQLMQVRVATFFVFARSELVSVSFLPSSRILVGSGWIVRPVIFLAREV